MIALAAKHHGIPFYSAAPLTTFDLAGESASISIEERDPGEVTEILGKRITPRGIDVFNPAFDVTPLEFVTGLITDRGVFSSEQVRNMPAM